MVKLHICGQCGKEFPHKYNTTNKFCSRECYQENRKEHPELYKSETINAISSEPLRLIYQCVCEYCGKPFETDNIQKKYCSQECQYKAGIQKAIKRQHDRNVANYKPKLIRCKECGKEFVPEFGEKRSSFCSDKCMRKWCNKQGNYNREMRLRGALVDKDITLKRVAQRDKDICYLCGHPVDWNDYSDISGNFLVGPNYPSVEHVIPIAKGGKHAWNNVRLAHCHCNSLKGDKILT